METTAEMTATPAATSSRVLSIDALRGFDMFWIIGGRNLALVVAALFADPVPARLADQLSHPEWIGFSAWDLIMPLFLFIVGTAMPFSFAKRLAQGQGGARLYGKIFYRTAVLFVLGMVAQGHLLDFDLGTLHVYCNTLQAIAVGYFVAAMLILHLPLIWQILVTGLLLAGYWALMTYVPVPGFEAGILEPQHNLALYVDRSILGRFDDGTTYTWILSGMGFASTTMLGVFAGQILRGERAAWKKLLWLVMIGVGCLAGGWLWGLYFPIIKHVWTSSMVLWAGGWSYLLLALFYLLIDVIGFRSWAFPFVVIGANAITVYVVTRLIDFRNITDPFVGGLVRHAGPYGELIRCAAALTLIWVLLWYMYRHKTFVRV